MQTDDIPSKREKSNRALVCNNGFDIEYIEKPFKAIQLIATSKDGSSIKRIEDPSLEVANINAVKKNALCLQYIKNPSGAVQLKATSENASSIRYIESPSEAVQLNAISHSVYSIRLARFIIIFL
jgi:hypothetical protein